MSPKTISFLSKDPIMKELIRNTDLPISSRSTNVFNALISSIISQQLSTQVASVIHKRVLDIYGVRSISPAMVLQTSDAALRAAGLSNQKLKYFRNIANYFSTPGNKRIPWSKLSDTQIIERLTSIKGIGVWTVQMILMFNLDRPDVFPSGDLGIQLSMKQFYKVKGEKKQLIRNMEQIAQQWSPYRTMASRYLWAARDKSK